MSLKENARVMLEIFESGSYTAPSGKQRDITEVLKASIDNTKGYLPEELTALVSGYQSNQEGPLPQVTVTGETTQIAARRLVQDQDVDDLVLLNFASARNPGGGFIRGAKAQEEDLCRCSGLYPTLLAQDQYYLTNRNGKSLLYSDHMIYSPSVPWLKVSSKVFIETPFLASVITAPAPNAGQVARNQPESIPMIEATLRRRAAMVLAVARDQGRKNLLLGAWGCGVFKNDPKMVAQAFHDALLMFSGCFDGVTFAVLDLSADQSVRGSFESVFSA